MKDERELLTKSKIAEQLAWEVQRTILSAAILCVITSLLLPLLCRLLMMLLESKAPGALAWLAALPGLILFTISVTRSLMQLGKARRGEFLVVEDVLTDVQADRLNRRRAFLYGDSSLWNRVLFGRWYDLSCYEHIFSFQSGRRYIATAQEYQGSRLETVADFSLPGDTFILAVYEDAPQKIVLLFSAKIYRYAEDGTARP